SQGDRAIHLRWKKPASRRPLRFRIARREASAADIPSSYREVGETAGCSLADSQVETGRSYCYRVTTEVRDGKGRGPDEVIGPVLAVGEVSNLQGHGGNGSARLVWQSPPGVRRIEVRRQKDKVPDADGPDVTVLRVTGEEVVDRGL